ncbi:MAG: hypothetical protein ACE5LC_07255 [Candidatus Aminicenantales bacterium]
MLKKQKIVTILTVSLVIIALGFLSVTAKTTKVRILSKKSHAERLWQTSGHADTTAEAFRHWDEDGEIPNYCAKCHSRYGFIDFLADGSVDSNAALGTTVDCQTCHSDEERGIVRTHTTVTFPSGAQFENLGHEALCMECHQGRESTDSVNEHIDAAGVPDDDTPSPNLSFRNIHYYAAAASQFGTWARGGYEYEGKSYDARFSHIKGYNACITCHNPHSLEVDFERCSTCHSDTGPKNITFPGSFFSGLKDPRNIRYYGSFTDYDGDGDMEEGIYYEIQTLLNKLYQAIQAYAANVIGAPIVYDAHVYPYFFHDTNGNGEPDPDETNYGNKYSSFTARLIRATYNFQFAKKDPAGYAHGGKYIIELLYDSIEDLMTVLFDTPLTGVVDTADMHRTDEGHFDGSAEAWRHFDEDGEVRDSCAKCHSAEGLAYFLENGENVAEEVANGFLCTTCHTSPPGLRRVTQVTFPSGIVKDMGDSSNICITCHQGRASKKTVDDTIATNPAGPYTFINVHYYAVGAVLYGTDVQGGYEFEGKTYAGQKTWPNHGGRFDTCTECHMGTKSIRKITDNLLASSRGTTARTPKETGYEGRSFSGRKKSLRKNLRLKSRKAVNQTTTADSTYGDHNVHKPNPADCVGCHGQDVAQPDPGADPAKFKFSGIRPASIPDYDGDGNTSESIKYEIKGLEEALYAQIQDYAANVIGQPIIYAPANYPYFFYDLNGNGQVDPGENIYPNRYKDFDAALLKCAYNYQFSKKEPHGYIHNSRYIAQLLVDSIENLGGDVSAYTWR